MTGADLREARLNGAELQMADLRAADLRGAELNDIPSIAGADFSRSIGLGEAAKARLASRPARELDTWNPFTRTTTRASLTS